MFGSTKLPTTTSPAPASYNTLTSVISSYPSSPLGTEYKFHPPTGTDTMMQHGLSRPISTRHQCITGMKEYECKSIEELRLEDYIMNRNLTKRTPNVTCSNPTTAAFTFSNPATINLTFSKPSSTPFPISSQSSGFKSNALRFDASTQTDEQELCVAKLLQGLKETLLNSKYSDFILNVKGKEFRVHKIILAAHSPVFAAMMEHDTKEKATGVANIDDFESITFSNFLNFLYTGKAENLNPDNVFDLYEVADKYQVTELSNVCIKYLMNNISVENFCETLTLSLRHHVRVLTDVATQFFVQNSKEIVLTASWTTFLAKNPVAGNELFLKVLDLKSS